MRTQRVVSFHADLVRFVYPSPAPRGLRRMLKIVGEPGLMCAFLMRLQISFEAKKRFGAARIVHLVNLRVTGAEVGHGCQIGPGFVAKHPLGMVVGGGTQIGANCTVLHNVTFGELRPGVTSAAGIYPVVGDDVVVGNGAALLGPVVVGHHAVIGAGAVVIRDVPSRSTAVGVPARIVTAEEKTSG